MKFICGTRCYATVEPRPLLEHIVVTMELRLLIQHCEFKCCYNNGKKYLWPTAFTLVHINTKMTLDAIVSFVIPFE